MTSSMSRVHPGIRPPALVAVAMTGALLGSVWDLLHVATHTTIYSSGIGRMPWWVPVEFSAVYVIGVIGIVLLGSPSTEAGGRQRLAAEAGWVTLIYSITALLHRYELVVAAVAIAGLIARRETVRTVVRANPIPAIALVLAGSVVESVLIAADVFRYTDASLGNIPVWLPLLYANAVPFAIRLAEAAVAFGSRPSEVAA
jgi:hypothetical protein